MSKRQQQKIVFTPRWPGEVQGHAVNTVRSFFPKLCAEHEFDDLLQEAYIVFMKCKAKFYGDNPAWFMALFSQSLRNRLINLSAVCGRQISLDDPTVEVPEPSGGENDAFARVVMNELPEAVKQLIHAVCFGPGPEGRAACRKLLDTLPALT